MNTEHHPDGQSTTMVLTRKRKAAMIVQMMLSDGGKLSLSSLPEELQEMLALEMGQIRLVDRDTVNAVAEEFTQLLSAIGMSAPGGPSAVIESLAELISPDLAVRLRGRFGPGRSPEHWQKIVDLDVDRLSQILLAESIEVGAVILSKLPVAKAAALLAAIPGERARRITFAVAQTENIGPDAVSKIGTALIEEYGNIKRIAFEKPPVDRVGAILNSSTALTRDDMLAGLDDADAQFAKQVRKAIFTFVDIPVRLRTSDIPNIVRVVDADVLSLALAAALAGEPPLVEAAEFILANISQRMAGQMREDAAEKGTIKTAVAEEAMNKVTTAIREQADSGAISLIDPDEQDADA